MPTGYVVCSVRALAEEMFPPGGDAKGTASYELFERLVVRGAAAQFATGFEELPVGLAGAESIRFVMTHQVPFFPPLVIYGMLVSDEDGTDRVELVGLTVDESYWDQIGDDPV